jgi:hypothetical protein
MAAAHRAGTGRPPDPGHTVRVAAARVNGSPRGATLVGHCYGRTGAERRGQFEAWCAAIGATPDPDVTTATGTIHLRAVAPNIDGLVDIILLADLYADDETAAFSHGPRDTTAARENA